MTVAVIEVPVEVVATISALSGAVDGPIVLAGGWAVRCRLRMARAQVRATEDVDAILTADLRPAAAALAAASLVQNDPEHPCRLAGAPLVVDLLAADDAVVAVHDVIEDADGLRLIVPPAARFLVSSAERVVLESPSGERVDALLPRAGALLAAKVGNIALENRAPMKRATDADDAVRLMLAFGALALMDDLAGATAAERHRLRVLLAEIGASGFAAQVALAGQRIDKSRLETAVAELAARLQ